MWKLIAFYLLHQHQKAKAAQAPAAPKKAPTPTTRPKMPPVVHR
jgi:hypothetical protein